MSLTTRPQCIANRSAGRCVTHTSNDKQTVGTPVAPVIQKVTPVTQKKDAGGEHSQDLDPLPPARLWLVDGYNALHSAPFRSTSGTANPAPASQKPFWSNTMRERLVAFARCFPDPHAEICLVFDGSRAPEVPARGDQPRVMIEFSPSADDWIVKRVRNAEDPTTIAVVSGDRQLCGRARHHGAAVVSPRLFLSHCGAGAAAGDGGWVNGWVNGWVDV